MGGGDGVLQNYTSGLIVVVARNLESALKLIEEKYPYSINNFPVNKYKVYSVDEENVFLVEGGD